MLKLYPVTCCKPKAQLREMRNLPISEEDLTILAVSKEVTADDWYSTRL